MWSGDELGATFDEIDIPETWSSSRAVPRELIDTRPPSTRTSSRSSSAKSRSRETPQGVRYCTIENMWVPILNGTAFKNKAYSPARRRHELLPSPVDLPQSRARPPGPTGRAQAVRQRALRGPGVQDHERPPRRSPQPTSVSTRARSTRAISTHARMARKSASPPLEMAPNARRRRPVLPAHRRVHAA